MSFSGIVNRIEISSTGLECCVEFDFGSKIGRLNCYMLLAKEYEAYYSVNEVDIYVEDGEARSIKIGEKKDIELSVVFGNNCSKINLIDQEKVSQPINKSSHTNFIATIEKIIDKYTITCSIGKLGGNILVAFESEVDYLGEKDIIGFSGEIKAELSKRL